jgi:hypothetical protein
VKKLIASRVAAELTNEDEFAVDMVKGGFGELSVSLEDRKIFKSSPLWYPTPAAVIRKVREAILE